MFEMHRSSYCFYLELCMCLHKQDLNYFDGRKVWRSVHAEILDTARLYNYVLFRDNDRIFKFVLVLGIFWEILLLRCLLYRAVTCVD